MMRAAWLSLILAAIAGTARSDDSTQPYIDSIKKRLQQEDKGAGSDSGSVSPYIDSLKAKLKDQQSGGNQDYIDSVRKNNPAARPENATGSYSEQERSKLAPKETGGAIEAVNQGRSDLQMKRDTNIRYAGGFSVDAPFTRNYVASGSAATHFSYNDIYGNGTLPSFSGFFEIQPYHIEWLGNVGFIGMMGLQYASGTGRFGDAQANVPARTPFHFFEIPVAVGVDLRINLAKYIKPTFVLAPEAIGYLETRSDGVSGHHGYSTGFYASGGVWFLMDWISRSNTWEAYQDGIKHYYITAEVMRQDTLSGDVTFNSTAINIGFGFEF